MSEQIIDRYEQMESNAIGAVVRSQTQTPTDGTRGVEGAESPGLLENASAIADLEDSLSTWALEIESLTNALARELDVAGVNPKQIAADLVTAGRKLSSKVGALRTENDRVSGMLLQMEAFMVDYVSLASEFGDTSDVARSLDAALSQISPLRVELQEANRLLDVAARMSRALRPSVGELKRSVRILGDLETLLSGWSKRLKAS